MRTAPTAIPLGSVVGKSFNECTTKSTQPVAKAVSNSFVNKDFSPIFGRGMSSTLSPNVLIVTIKKNYISYIIRKYLESTYQFQIPSQGVNFSKEKLHVLSELMPARRNGKVF